MKRRDLDKLLIQAGWYIQTGGSHDMAKNKNFPGVKIPLPRHTEINENTAKTILKNAGITGGKGRKKS